MTEDLASAMILICMISEDLVPPFTGPYYLVDCYLQSYNYDHVVLISNQQQMM